MGKADHGLALGLTSMGLVEPVEEAALVVAGDVEVHLLVEFLLPLLHHGGGTSSSAFCARPEVKQFTEDHARLDGLAEAHLVGEQVAARIGRDHSVDEFGLVREWLCPCCADASPSATRLGRRAGQLVRPMQPRHRSRRPRPSLLRAAPAHLAHPGHV